MFRKLTTIIDSALARKLETDVELLQSPRFIECLALGAKIVCAAASELQDPNSGEQVMNSKYTPLNDWNSTAKKLCRVIFAAHRLEIVISGFTPGFLHWQMFLYGKSDKVSFYRVDFQVCDGELHCGYGSTTPITPR